MSTTSENRERRRKPEAVRSEALAVGQRLLIEGGPRAITLKAVGAELGMSHANLIHHFGSAEAFQAQLSDAMLLQLTRTVTDLVERHARGAANVPLIVDAVFEAYGPGGVGMLVAWAALTGETRVAEGLTREVDALVAVLEQLNPGPDAAARARDTVRLVTSLAFADSLIGGPMSVMLGQPPGEGRARAVRLLQRLEKTSAPP